jgi:cell fate (sporulation/competence/biofilm development) regulator YlbF (YheA/YmcA/DUF963 family)
MTLSPELQQAAQEFGAALRQHGIVEHYLQAVAALAADPEASALDQRFESIRADLIKRQGAGEELPADEVQEFYILRDEVAGHPLIEKRDNALTMAKGYLVNVGLDLNQALGLDFVKIASS